MRVGPLAHATWPNISQAAHLASTKGIGSLAWRIHHNDLIQNAHVGNYIEPWGTYGNIDMGFWEYLIFELMYVYTRICLYIYICIVSPKKTDFFSGCYVLKTDGENLTRHPENRRENFDPSFWEKLPDENLADMWDPSMHAESTDSWGILKIEKPKWKIWSHNLYTSRICK